MTMRTHKKTLISLILPFACIFTISAQAPILTVSRTNVCSGDTVLLKVDPNNCSRIRLEKRETSFDMFYVHDNYNSGFQDNVAVIEIDWPIVFRVRGQYDGETVYSEEIVVNTEWPLIITWSDDKIGLLESGDTVKICDEEELKYVFGSDFENNDDYLFKDNYFSEWYKDGVKVNDDFTTSLGMIYEDCKVTNVLSNKSNICPPTSFDFNYKITKTPELEIQPSTSLLCQGNEATIDISYGERPEMLIWKEDDGIQVVSDDQVDFRSKVVSPATDTKYWVEACNGECCSESEKVTIEVKEGGVKFDILAPESEICKGEDIRGEVMITDGRPEQIVWKKNEQEWSYSSDMHDTPNETAEYKVEILDACGTTYSEMYEVMVGDPQIEVADKIVCEGTPVTLSANCAGDLSWYSDSDKTDLVGVGNGTVYYPSESSTDLYVVAKDGNCEAEATMNIVMHSKPIIESHEILSDKSGVVLNVEGGFGKLYYSVEGESELRESNIITGIKLNNDYRVMVEDENGCSSTYDIIGISIEINVPSYFIAPNENWKIENLDLFNNVSLKIFDRYGKLLYSTNDPSEGWDGKYMGYDMPSTDYWYVLTIDDVGQDTSGHFTLLREQ